VASFLNSLATVRGEQQDSKGLSSTAQYCIRAKRRSLALFGVLRFTRNSTDISYPG
jgi:hypothetical protein